MEGVVRIPSAFSMTFGVFPSMTATHEFVVPRSMPMTLPMRSFLSSMAGRLGPVRHPKGRIRALRPAADPLIHLDAAPCGVLAHIGGPLCAARHVSGNRGLTAGTYLTSSTIYTFPGRNRSMLDLPAGLRLVPGFLDARSQAALASALEEVLASAPFYLPRMPRS